MRFRFALSELPSMRLIPEVPLHYDSNILHSDKNDNRLQFPWRPALHYIFALLLFGAALPAFVNCHRARDLENPKRNTMTMKENTSEAEALSIHHRAIIVDMHADTAQRMVDESIDLNRRLTEGH